MSAGVGWEKQLEAWHRRYRLDGVAYVVKTEPPVVQITRPDSSGRFRACYKGSAPVDFVGFAAGRAVAFDAKHTASIRFSLSAIADHQVADLRAASAAGVFAFVALRCPAGCYVLPWATLDGWRARSLSMDDVEAVGLPMDADGWLSCLAR